LAYYDGTNGKPAWIAVYGNLYDVTNETAWKNGVHRGLHLGGKDASSAFDSSPHSQSLLNSLTHIGYLIP
jgi:predicted heme/steroid binding protein